MTINGCHLLHTGAAGAPPLHAAGGGECASGATLIRSAGQHGRHRDPGQRRVARLRSAARHRHAPRATWRISVATAARSIT